MHQSRRGPGRDRETDVETEIYYTSNEVFDAADLRRTLPKNSINAVDRRRPSLAVPALSAVASRRVAQLLSIRRTRATATGPEAPAARRHLLCPTRPADLHAEAVQFLPAPASPRTTAAVSMEENRRRSAAWRGRQAEMTRCSYVLIPSRVAGIDNFGRRYQQLDWTWDQRRSKICRKQGWTEKCRMCRQSFNWKLRLNNQVDAPRVPVLAQHYSISISGGRCRRCCCLRRSNALELLRQHVGIALILSFFF